MGNRNANEQNDDIIRENEQILIQNDVNNQMAKLDPPSVKKIFAVRNPFSIKKTSLILEKDAGPTNLYYIKFQYDSIYNFNCYINFDVMKNPLKQLNPKQIQFDEDYVLAYTPSPAFESKKILIKNLPKGENMEFFEKEAAIDIDYFKENKADILDQQNFDMSIELVPIWENNNNNEVVLVSLCSFEQGEIGKHPHSVKIDQQKLKTYGMWLDIHDIYNSALDTGECLICCSAYRNTVFLPCNHSCTCNTCAHSLKMRNNPCPICKNQIKDLLIIEVDEVVKPINIADAFDEDKKEDIIDVNEENFNPILDNEIHEGEKKIVEEEKIDNIENKENIINIEDKENKENIEDKENKENNEIKENNEKNEKENNVNIENGENKNIEKNENNENNDNNENNNNNGIIDNNSNNIVDEEKEKIIKDS